MKEIKAIIEAYQSIKTNGVHAALATVVRVEGSSYRRTGARMLVMDDGVWVGGISGGCLEGDALKRARLAIAKSEPSLITYDTTEDDAYQIGVGLGCNGIIDVLFTPLDFNNTRNPVEILTNCINGPRQINVLVTITGLEGEWGRVKLGDLLRYDNQQSLAVFEDEQLQGLLENEILAQSASNRSAPHHFELADKKLSVFIEVLLPEINLVLMGHQYDVYPLARIAKETGCGITLVSNPLKINTKFAAAVDAVLAYDQFDNILVDGYTAIVLMAHDYKTDKNNLAKALKTPLAYIGMLGPRVRSEKIFRELIAEGCTITDEDMERIYAPAGLDIGALSPEEIALAIIAEIKTVFAKREGGFLKLRHAPIHERG